MWNWDSWSLCTCTICCCSYVPRKHWPTRWGTTSQWWIRCWITFPPLHQWQPSSIYPPSAYFAPLVWRMDVWQGDGSRIWCLYMEYMRGLKKIGRRLFWVGWLAFTPPLQKRRCLSLWLDGREVLFGLPTGLLWAWVILPLRLIWDPNP